MNCGRIWLLLALLTLSGCSPRPQDSKAVEATVPDSGLDGPTPQPESGITYPVPVRPTPPKFVQPGAPVNLAPTDDCVHPEVAVDCVDGSCLILPGCFIMGAPRDRPEAGRYADVQVQVTLSHAFMMGEAEVTNAEWKAAGFELPLRDVDVARCTDPECPVTNVNFYETLTFLNEYSEQQGLEPCIPLAYAAEQKVEVAYGVDHAHLLSWQVEVSAPRETEDGEFRSGVWPVAGEPDELCGVAEVFSWLDETTSRVRYCVPNPKPELDPIRETVSSFGHITECTIPPTEYEEQWCFSQAYTCEQDVLTLPEVEKEDVAAACEHYRDVCDQRFPAEPPAAHASTSSTAEPPPDPAEGTAAKSNSGCSTSGALILRLQWHHSWLLVTLFMLEAIRRRPLVARLDQSAVSRSKQRPSSRGAVEP